MPTLTIPPSRNLNGSPGEPVENSGLSSGKRKTFKLVAKHNSSLEMEVYRNGIVLGSWQFSNHLKWEKIYPSHSCSWKII